MMATSSNNLTKKSGVVIVGGGPAGLATAIMLSKRGWRDIKVLESRPTAEFEEPDKSFVYGIDGRGRKLLDKVNLTHLLPHYGVVGDIQIARVATDGSVKRSTIAIKDPSKLSYWMPRKALLKILHEGVKAANGIVRGDATSTSSAGDSSASSSGGNSNGGDSNVEVLMGTSCTDIQFRDGAVQVQAASASGEVHSWQPALLVGADGLHSKVREALDAHQPESGRFRMQKVHSDAAGLRYKVLQLPPNPPANKKGDDRLLNHQMAVIEGALKGPKHAARLGLLPVKDPEAGRPANIIVKEGHEFFEMDTAEKLYGFLEASFPQFPVRELIPPEAAEQYAQSKGGRFPSPQQCSGYYHLVGTSSATAAGTAATASKGAGAAGASGQEPGQQSGQEAQAAVLLVGDAIHCFPPDLGQGVNSALEDISVLDEVLSEVGDDMSKALPLYEERRSPDIRALIRLMQFGYPHQYNQDPTARFIWTLNFMLRLALNKLLPFLFAPPAFMMVQDPSLSYREILARADRSTRLVQSLAVAAAIAIAVRIATGGASA